MSRSGQRANGCPGSAALALDLLQGRGRHSAHRRRCTECARTWQALRRLESRLGRLAEGVPPSPGESCPAALDWAALADGTPGRRRAELVEHLVECDACAALWSFLCRLPVAADGDRRDRNDPNPEIVRESEEPLQEKEPLQEQEDDAPGLEVGAHATPRSGRAPGRAPASRRGAVDWRLRVAAAVLAAGGILAWLALPPPPVLPGGGERLRGDDPALVTEFVPGTSRAAWRLRWEGGPVVDTYRLRLWNGAGELLLERSLPPERGEWTGPLPEEDEVYWQVEGLREGRVVAAGPLSRLPVTGTERRSR